MPIYEYECGACEHRLEVIQKVNEPPRTDCPECGEARLKKLLSVAGFRLKGSGWYETDFKNSGSKPKAAKSTEAKSTEAKSTEAKSTEAKSTEAKSSGSSSSTKTKGGDTTPSKS